MSFFRKSVRLKTVTLAITVVYLGFAKSQLISIVNVFALLEWNLPIFKCASRGISWRRSRSSPPSSGAGCAAGASAHSAP